MEDPYHYKGEDSKALCSIALANSVFLSQAASIPFILHLLQTHGDISQVITDSMIAIVITINRRPNDFLFPAVLLYPTCFISSQVKSTTCGIKPITAIHNKHLNIINYYPLTGRFLLKHKIMSASE